jgi:hypothetical protein
MQANFGKVFNGGNGEPFLAGARGIFFTCHGVLFRGSCAEDMAKKALFNGISGEVGIFTAEGLRSRRNGRWAELTRPRYDHRNKNQRRGRA